MTPEEELIVREMLITTKVAPSLAFNPGYVLAGPVYFSNRADYMNTMLGDAGDDPETHIEVDLMPVQFAAVYLKTPFTDDPDSSAHSPLTDWFYEVYVFSEQSRTRADEDPSPDEFNKKMLLRHNQFIASILNLKAVLQGELNFTGLTGYSTNQTLPLTVREEILNRAECEFVPGVFGNSIRLGSPVRLQLEAC